MAMKRGVYGLKVKVAGIGYIDSRLHRQKEVLAFAGKVFHDPIVESVCVYDGRGTARLFLKKDLATGKCIQRERRKRMRPASSLKHPQTLTT
jgi:hypothetical protein